MAKKVKEPKGFVDYHGQVLHILPSRLSLVQELMRRAIMQAGAPDFGELLLGNMMVAIKDNVKLAFIEVAQKLPGSTPPDYLTFSIPLQHLVQTIGKDNYYIDGTASVRNYRAAAKYVITVKTKPVLHKPVSAA